MENDVGIKKQRAICVKPSVFYYNKDG